MIVNMGITVGYLIKNEEGLTETTTIKAVSNWAYSPWWFQASCGNPQPKIQIDRHMKQQAQKQSFSLFTLVQKLYSIW